MSTFHEIEPLAWTSAQRVRPKVECRILRRPDGEEVVLFDPESGAIHSLNSSGRFIFDLCDGSCTIHEITEALKAKYEIDPDRARQEVLAFLQKMGDLGLIRMESSDLVK